ncbi:MAG: glycosyltransferase family 4 protein, partial [Bacteroidales bacterium]|nr:glycosyltransferase family 4 protein [Bacteroidales bacterium]
MTNKRIWIICHYATPRQYGYGTRQFLLAEEYLKLGYEVTVFASPSNYQLNKVPSLRGLFTRENINGVETVWVWGIRYSNPAGLKRVLSWFIFSFLLLFYPVPKKKLPGIIVVSSLSLVTVINGLFLKLRSPKSQFIFEIRDIWPLTLTDIGGYSPYNPLVILLGWIEKTGYRKADNIVATMPRADLHIRKRIGSDFNFTCIPQGLDLYDAGSDSELSEEERKAIFPEDGFIIGYAGAFGRSNSLDTLVKAARLINDRGIQGIHFILLGDGSEKDRLVSLAEGLGNLKFVPRMPRKKVHAFLKCCS